ncbi:helix-turn-helix domain-containing protein [Nereida sp. MMG025]|uniref:helix-turn-helix domain-containing protein n=1 Tax=Nereida sp. MMG025 TaxID=2909981 RepID=UPI001F3A5E30|nr:helix-turn-helix transcriptional regulator [Nereida sp. MMG025]MCF6443712.1 short-chain fatty acyl-CoA regulator family protein [Nereida sp. MMG025]
MPASALTGTRIREHRLAQKMRQADLARDAGISASYLNLIEHNRRRIAGKVLADIARVLGVEASSLAEGAERSVIEAIQTAAAEAPGFDASAASAEDVASRYPDWARLIADQRARITQLEHSVNTLTDRLAHDPFLTDALHEVISSVTSIRSSSSILSSDEPIEPDWQKRFQQNIFNDSRRLAESAQSLASYLEGTSGETANAGTPLEDCFGALQAAEYHFSALESPDANAETVAAIVGQAALSSDAARAILRSNLERYLSLAQSMPMAAFADVSSVLADPVSYARHIGQPLANVLQRLSYLPQEVVGQPIGLVQCDAAGALVARKPIKGFDVPRIGSACSLWPVYASWSRMGMPIKSLIQQDGQGRPALIAYTATTEVIPASFERACVYEAVMLVRYAQSGEVQSTPQLVGATCRVCAISDCPARREPSVLGSLRSSAPDDGL